MTAPSDEAADPSAWAALARQLRVLPDAVLAACALVGLLGFALLGVLGTAWAGWLAPLIVVGAAGGWGVADREFRERETRGGATRLALQLGRSGCTLLGTAALILFVGRVVAVLFGTVIS